MNRRKERDYEPVTVPFAATPTGKPPSVKDWANRCVWTDPMLNALEAGVRGGKWHTLIDKVFGSLNLFTASLRVIGNEGAAGVDHQTVEDFKEFVEQAHQRRLVVDAEQRAAAQAHQALGMVEDDFERDVRLRRRPRLLSRVGVRAGEDPAEARPAGGVLDQQGQVMIVVEIDLRPMDRAEAQRTGGDRELHRARDRVVIGQRKCAVAQLDSGRHQFIWKRGSIQERERGVTVQLDVGHEIPERMFAPSADVKPAARADVNPT